MYKTLIRPIALYGAESWNMTLADGNTIGGFELKEGAHQSLAQRRKETYTNAGAMQKFISCMEMLILSEESKSGFDGLDMLLEDLLTLQ